MKRFWARIIRKWNSIESLDERIYRIVLVVGIFAALICLVADVIQQLPTLSIITTFALMLYLILLQGITLRFPKYQKICRVALVIGINLVLFPLIFFSSGGIRSGMVLFYMLGFFLDAILLQGNLGGVIFLLSFFGLELSITLADRFPHAVADMTDVQFYQDVKVTLFLAGFSLYAISVLIFMAYDRERKHNQELMNKLRNLSIRDALSGLYNRRELFRRLDVMYQGPRKERTETLTREKCYIAMFDVDNFKHLNDTYGHSFGDEVLSQVAHQFQDMVDPAKGELAARYGGEEFVCVLYADTTAEAYRRVDEARQKIAALRWEEVPGLTVTVSGGIISCEDHPDLTQAMHDVDVLLYQAKAAGKNRVCHQMA